MVKEFSGRFEPIFYNIDNVFSGDDALMAAEDAKHQRAFDTIKDLILQPGFLGLQVNHGREQCKILTKSIQGYDLQLSYFWRDTPSNHINVNYNDKTFENMINELARNLILTTAHKERVADYLLLLEV